MEEKKQVQEKESNGTGCAIVLLVVFLLIFVPILIGIVSDSIQTSNEAKHKTELIEEGKVKTHDEVINEIVEILKSKDEVKIKSYLSKDFIYYDNDNIEHKYISSFFEDLNIYTTSYEIEKRGNSIEDEETYRIYWNIVEENKKNGIKRQEHGYCLQTITVMLKKVVRQNEITYEIEKIILRDA